MMLRPGWLKRQIANTNKDLDSLTDWMKQEVLRETKGKLMRKLASHKCGNMNDDLEILVLDEPGSGGACHKYGINYHLNPGTPDGGVHRMCEIQFQNGPIKQAGINGITNEALLAIVEDRLIGFQSGEYACRENALALTRIQEAMMWLQNRTRSRMARGVEGTSEK